MTFDEARALFPVLARYAYLNAGSVGPIARPTIAAMERELHRELEEGRGGAERFEAVVELRRRVREALARVLGVDGECVAVTSSTTESCRLVVAGLDLGADDEVVTTDVEHFGLTGPLAASGARVRVAEVRDRQADEAYAAILREIGPRTRLVALSHVAWTTGHELPVGELEQELTVPLLVDGAQSVGAIPVDATPYDFYTVSGQKWLCGPDSTGALYVREPESLRVAAPSYLSQETYEPDGSFSPKPGAARFDPGWTGGAVLEGVLAALEVAPAWRYERASQMAARCRELLAERADVVTEPGHATLVTWRAEGDTKQLVQAAHEQGVVIRELPRLGWLRASCGWWTNEEDLERLVAAVA
ncbi:MAG: aminotransferase class V-fold PLP-dependent enzyme [Thermoleophilia bacterium]|nr:aminotransferase class V-fold PLP-dependent enzyme [Thermoleophilia bacterium]